MGAFIFIPLKYVLNVHTLKILFTNVKFSKNKIAYFQKTCKVIGNKGGI